MDTALKSPACRQAKLMLLTMLAVLIIILCIALGVCHYVFKAENHMRYTSMTNIVSQRIAKTVSGMEMNAKNVFDEVEKHMDTPESVIAALESKTSLNPDVRGYFAAFEPNYFPQKGRWFEPYVHQPDSTSNGFEVRLVGSARHDYTKSAWYIRAKESSDSFWSDPYYYYDGTSISGHYCTFVKPVFSKSGQLACVCGADMTFEWLAKELVRIDQECKNDEMLNKYNINRKTDFFSVILNNDGSCIAHPEGRRVPITDTQVIAELTQKKSGTVEMTVNGTPSMVYYAPIDNISWSVAVIVPKDEFIQPLMLVGYALLAITMIGMLVVWLIIRRTRNAKTA